MGQDRWVVREEVGGILPTSPLIKRCVVLFLDLLPLAYLSVRGQAPEHKILPQKPCLGV